MDMKIDSLGWQRLKPTPQVLTQPLTPQYNEHLWQPLLSSLNCKVIKA